MNESEHVHRQTRAVPTVALPNGLRKREQWLEHLVNAHDWRVGAELGVWRGRTFLHLLKSCPRLTLYGVDLWLPDLQPKPKDEWMKKSPDWSHTENERRVRDGAQVYGERAIVIKMSTREAANLIPDSSLDFVFIDADHSEEGVRQDIQCWMSKVKNAGWLLGHDINRPTVRIVVEKLLPDYLVGPDNTWGRPKIDVESGIRYYLAKGNSKFTRRHKSIGERLKKLFRINKHGKIAISRNH